VTLQLAVSKVGFMINSIDIGNFLLFKWQLGQEEFPKFYNDRPQGFTMRALALSFHISLYV
jgi:hypothetical protein